MKGKDRGKVRRSYRPGVEALEALSLLSDLVDAPHDLSFDHASITIPVESFELAIASTPNTAWDAALVSSQVDSLLGTSRGQVDAADVTSGLAQLDRYLARSWFRAGIAPQQHDDSTQAVYTSLLQGLGRDRFDQLLADVGQFGIRDVLSRETPEGPDFFRAIDSVKKRVQRERSFQPLDAVEVASSRSENAQTDWKGMLQEAILSSLSPREAALIQATLNGETPAEIAEQWGIAPKTVSNEKTRALQKLRDVLTSDFTE